MSVRTTVKSIQDIMRQDAGVDGDAQRISQLCWMFFLKIIDDQDQELELTRATTTARRSRSNFQWRTWAADPEGITGDALLDFVNDELFPALKDLPARRQARRPPPRRARRVRGRLQLHEVRPVDAAGHQQDQRASTSTTWPSASTSATSTSRSSTTCRAPATPASTTRRAPSPPSWSTASTRSPARSCSTPPAAPAASHLRHPPHARALREDGPRTSETMQAALRAVEKKQLPHMLCVTNMLLHGIEDPSFVRHDNTLARPYISYTPSRPRGHRPHQPAVRRHGGGRHRDQLPASTSAPARPPTCSSRSSSACSRPDGRAAVVLPDGIAVRRGREDAAQGAPAGGVQPPHHRPPAQQRVQALRLDRHQPAVLREGRRRPRTSGSTSTACPKARRPTR